MLPRLRLALLPLLGALLLSACVATPVPQAPRAPADAPLPAVSPDEFLAVASAVEPVAEAVCRSETPDQNCDFAILIDRDPRGGVNAFHTVDRGGRPIIILTLGLIGIFENGDELAFVLGHEAGHHIGRHIPQQQQSAAAGAQVFGEIAQARGAGARDVARAAELGAFVGARSFSQTAELEADVIGTVIAFRAGYDPVRGAELFRRLPDPGVQLLSSHPPNAQRLRVVRRTLAEIAGSG
jgi:predicted Zn-dependent protease